jgi:hypothetical protein
MTVPNMARRLLAVAALLALLTANVSVVAESLSASGLPACCNTVYCPVHHRQVRDLQKDKNDCNAHGNSALTDCSMRACDSAPKPVVEIAPFVLLAPFAVFYEANTQAAPLSASQFFPFAARLPLIQPPRTLPN